MIKTCPKFLLIFLCIALRCGAEDNLFGKKNYLGTGFGVLVPLPNINKYINPAFHLQFQASTSYTPLLDMGFQILATKLTIPHMQREIIFTKAGSHFQTTSIFGFSMGAGLSFYFIRGIHVSDKEVKLLLDSNEWEFGFYPFIRQKLFSIHQWTFSGLVQNDLVFSTPHFTSLGCVSLLIDYSL